MRKLIIAKSRSCWGTECSGCGGFTFIELLVVISTITLLAALLAPAMASSRIDSAAAKCMSNLRQVSAAWQMYADENRSVFAYNEPGGTPPAWVYGDENYSGASYNYNTNYLLNPQYAQLGLYVKTAALFKCPADVSLSFGTHGLPRSRSISMNAAVGLGSGGTSAGQGGWLPSPEYLCYFKQSDLGRPSPAGLFLIVEEHPDSINDISFAFEMPLSSATLWIDVPAKYHDNACNFAFADGHVEIHQWQKPQSIPNVTLSGLLSPAMVPNNPDVWWVGNHTSARTDGRPNPFPVEN
jgi:prepilin-type processing-associated H-X9-DG protein